MIEQEIIKLPTLELYRNFEGQEVIKLPDHGQVIVKSRAGNTYPVNIDRRTLYNEAVIEHPKELVAVIDNDAQPWRVNQIKRRPPL